MVRSKHEVDHAALAEVVAVMTDIRHEPEMLAFLNELLTPGEIRDFALRWRLMEMLAAGVPQRTIARELKVSLCKITRGSRILKASGEIAARLMQKKKAKK